MCGGLTNDMLFSGFEKFQEVPRSNHYNQCIFTKCAFYKVLYK